MSFESLGLLPELLRAVQDAGYTDPTPIQQQAIPVVLAGRDVMGGAQTGTGKTAGFTLPLLQRLARHANTSASPARHPVRALLLTPTRELAIQVHDSVKEYGKYLPLRSTVLYGGVDIKPQNADLMRGMEVVVATPGRLLDHVQARTISLNQVEVLVLDEADRMLDMGFIPDVRRILALLPAQRQSLMFSATFSGEIKKLADTMLRDPVLIEVARRNAVTETVTHRVHAVAAEDKRALLVHIARARDLKQALVFCNTKFGASRLAVHLTQQGIATQAIHGDKNQQQRLEALEAFKSGQVQLLVATDVAARGLDIEDMPCVVNFELPFSPEDYIHRIGRTGRAGNTGEALSLMAPEERPRLADIERLIKRTIPLEVPDGFDAHAAARQEREAHRALRRSRSEGGQREDGRRDDGRRGGGEDTRRSGSEGRRGPEDGRRSTPPPVAARSPAPGSFDFSKPYEPDPSASAVEETAPNAATGSNALTGQGERPSPRRPQREIPALLGGTPGRK
ncbi:MAG: DEAD/DEAH box helicase [Betaproteobacteria bacterium]|nr:DEAD/DEAH box helicase [Betaproteobacteria bacterium]